MKKDTSGVETTAMASRCQHTSMFGGSVEQRSAYSRQREELSKSRILEVRKQEESLARVNMDRYKREKQKVEEEEELLKAYQEYQAKLKEIEELKAQKEEALRTWAQANENAKTEEEKRIKLELDQMERSKMDKAKARERERLALEKEIKEKRLLELENERKRAVKLKVQEEERARAEVAAKAFQEKVKNMPEPPVIAQEFDKVQGIGGARKRFNLKDFEQTHSHCVVIGDDDESEDANTRALKVREEGNLKKAEAAMSKEEMRQRALEREKIALSNLKREKEIDELERKAQEERVKQSQIQVQANIEFEKMRLAGMRHNEVEKKFEKKIQDTLNREFELLFFGNRGSTQGHDRLNISPIGDRIDLFAFWKEPSEIVYETKKTMEWGPKNKKRDLQIPDIDRLLKERKMFRSRSQSKDLPKQNKSPKPQDQTPRIDYPTNERETAPRKRSVTSCSNEEVSFNYTEDDSQYGGLPYTKSQLLEKYRSRDGQDSPLRQTIRRNDETLEMTVSEDQSGEMLNFRGGSIGSQQSGMVQTGGGFLQSTDIGSYLEEQQRIIAQMERDRQAFKEQLAAGDFEPEYAVDEPSQEIYADMQRAEDVIRVRDELKSTNRYPREREDDIEEEEELSEELYIRPPQRNVPNRTVKPINYGVDWAQQGGRNSEEPLEHHEGMDQGDQDALLSKFLSFKPDSKWSNLVQQPEYQPSEDLKYQPAASENDLDYSDTIEDQMEPVESRHKPVDKQPTMKKASQASQPEPQVRANSRTKEEQKMLRKKMMQYNPMEASGMKKKASLPSANPGVKRDVAESGANMDIQGPPVDNVKLPNPELLSRLAKGEKAQVNREEMLQLTNKNYNNLPEVKKRREEQARKDDIKKRAEKQKSFGKEIRARSKSKGAADQEK